MKMNIGVITENGEKREEKLNGILNIKTEIGEKTYKEDIKKFLITKGKKDAMDEE